MNGHFVPAINNPYHSDYARFSSFTRQIAEDLVKRYWSQGGTDQSRLEPYMMESFVAVCEAIDSDCQAVWLKAWKAASNAPKEWRKQEVQQ